MTDHIKDQLCARIEELEAEKMELNEQLDIAQGEPVAWATRLYNTAYHAGHHDTVEGGYTHVYPQDMDSHHEDVVQEWLADNPQPAQAVAGLVEALESLIKGYVSLLEAGMDRITSLGGDCDPVPVMEQNDPWLRDARAALAKARGDL